MSDQPMTACLVETRLFDDPHPRRVFDVERMAYLVATYESARFFAENMPAAENLFSHSALLEFALSKRSLPGLTLEFGVATGSTLRIICHRTNGAVYGFDSFEGLPEDWTHFQKAGRFNMNGTPPEELPPNAELVVGWFADTLPGYVRSHQGNVSFVHMDCDLYSSTKTVLESLRQRIVPGTVIVFDEYFNYPGWQRFEHRAFSEFLLDTNLTARYIGFASAGQAVAVQIMDS